MQVRHRLVKHRLVETPWGLSDSATYARASIMGVGGTCDCAVTLVPVLRRTLHLVLMFFCCHLEIPNYFLTRAVGFLFCTELENYVAGPTCVCMMSIRLIPITFLSPSLSCPQKPLLQSQYIFVILRY